jgi:predicted transcriptional regulator
MGEIDEKGQLVKVWRKVDRKDFREFLFYVVGKKERLDLRKRTTPICPEVLYSVMMADGVTILNKTGLLNMVRKKAKEGYIRRYYEKKGITLPWDVKPNSWTIADEDKELLDKLKLERLNSALTRNSISGNPTAGSSEIKLVADKLAALERRIEVLQAPSTGGRSLDEIFSKLEALETRVAKVDVLSEKMDKTTAILDALCAKIGLV